MKIMTLLITMMISTTMVLAQHTMADARTDIGKIFLQLENVSEYQSLKNTQSCEEIDKTQILKRLNKRLAKAQRRNESLNTSLKKESRKYKRIKKRQARISKRILKKQRRINKYYAKALKINDELTKEAFVSKLKESLTNDSLSSGLAGLKETLIKAGSMENYLLNMKEALITCDKSLTGENTGFIYLAIFIGLPVLSILAALIALIFGGFNFALWAFLGALAILVVFFLIGNLGKNLFKLNEEEV